MKIVKLFHNPSAGDAEHAGKELVKLIEAAGYKCRYTSVKESGWKEIEEDTDIVAIAGGDGTVRKVGKVLLQRTLLDKKHPIALLPMGTANNVGGTLGLMGETEELVAGWCKLNIKSVDVGLVSGMDDDAFFLEAFGFGVFPNLMNEMKKLDDKPDDPEENLQLALEVLLKVVEEYEARECNLQVDGIDHSGKFLLVEIMNMRSIGPRLDINAHADPGDGELEIIVIPENQRDRLAQCVKDKLAGKETTFTFSALKGQDISLRWEGIHGHVDDTIIKADKSFELTIDVNKSVLDFILPEQVDQHS